MMKKIFLLLLLFAASAFPQKPKEKSNYEQRLAAAWLKLKQSKDSTALLIREIKTLSNQKIIYRTKIIEHTDTVSRIDTCITVFTAIDSATIAIIFQNRETPRPTTFGRIIRYIFKKKSNEKKH